MEEQGRLREVTSYSGLKNYTYSGARTVARRERVGEMSGL